MAGLLETTNRTIPDNDALLEEMSKELTENYVPLFVCMAIVIALGIMGNIMTVIFYGFKTKRSSSTTVFISSLAAIDLATCVVLSDRFIQLAFMVSFKNVIGCRLLCFMNHWFITSSVLVLWLISVDRYIKVCRYYAWQFTLTAVKKAIIAVIVFSLFSSVPNFVLVDIVRVNLTDIRGNQVQGYSCRYSNDQKLESAIKVVSTMDAISVLIIIATFVVLYSLIGRTIFISRKKTKAVNMSNKQCGNHSVANENIDKATTKYEQPTGISKENSNLKLETRITIIMFAITIGYVMSFCPFFVATLIVIPNSEISDELNVGIQFACSSMLLNSAINPYIIGIFNPTFREFVIRSFCACLCCFKKSPCLLKTTTTTPAQVAITVEQEI